MKNIAFKIILFSDYFQAIYSKISFIAIIVYRTIKILLHFSFKLKLIELNYSKKILFDNSYLIINYNFKNALWYRFSLVGSTLKSNYIIIDIKKIDTSLIRLKVFGLFQSKSYYLKIDPENKLKSSRFKTSLHFAKNEYFTPNVLIQLKRPQIIESKLACKVSKIGKLKINLIKNNHKIKIHNSKFIKSEFI